MDIPPFAHAVSSDSLPAFFKIYLFVYFWLCWVFLAACGLSLVVASGGYSVAVRGLLIAVVSLVAEHGL